MTKSDKRVPQKLKGKFYRTAIRPAMLYGAECWPTKRRHVQQLSVAEMRMLRWFCGHTRRDRVRNEVIRDRVGVAPIEEKLTQHRLRWFGHVQQRPPEAPVHNVKGLDCSFFSCFPAAQPADPPGHPSVPLAGLPTHGWSSSCRPSICWP